MSQTGFLSTATASTNVVQPHGTEAVAISHEDIGAIGHAVLSSLVRLQVLSDLHHDVRPAVPPPSLAPNADLVVVAGDACQGPRCGFAHLRRTIPAPTPIVMVLGNHEHYRGYYPEVIAEARQLAPSYGITVLENSMEVIAGVRFLGCTLWTDYALDGQQGAAMATAQQGLNDHRMIGWRKQPWLRFRPEEALAIHHASRRFLTDAIAAPFAGPTAVVTHHAPHSGSVHPRYAGDPLNAAFASDLSGLVAAGQPTLWVHGHVHSSFDYAVGTTRIVCNTYGYGSENPAYDPRLIVEVAR